MRLEDYLHLFRRRWPVIALTALLGLGIAAGLTAIQRPQYTATAESFLAAGSSDSVSDLSQGATYAQAAATGYARIATTEYILTPVIRDLGLDVTPQALAKRITATPDTDSAVIEITVTDPSATRAAAIANTVSDRLASAVETLTPGGGTTPVKITRVQSAVAATTPTTPNVPLDLAIGGLSGLLLGAAIALTRDALDTRLRGTDDLEHYLGVPVLGDVLSDPGVRSRPLVVAADEQTPQAEAYRTIRANLRFLGVREPTRSLVVTSAIADEGKSTTAANLALAVSLVEQDVVIVDADLRRPRLHELFGIDGRVGLVDVLIGAATLDEALQQWGGGALRILPAGRIPPNPGELLQSDEMGALIEELHARFRTVVFDTPPLLPVADAAVLAHRASGAVVTARLRSVRRPQIREALQILQRADARTLGAIVTMRPQRSGARYGYAHPAAAGVATAKTAE